MLAAAMLLAGLCQAAAASGRRLAQAAPLPAPTANRTLTVINMCSQALRIGMGYPFDNSDPTQGNW